MTGWAASDPAGPSGPGCVPIPHPPGMPRDVLVPLTAWSWGQFLAGGAGALGVEWGEDTLPEFWGGAWRARGAWDGTWHLSFLFPPFGSSYLFQFSKYVCNGLENWEGKAGREQPPSYLNRTLNSEWFINKINNSSRVLGWEISPVFGFYSAAEGNFTVLFNSVPAQLTAGTVQESPALGTCHAALCHTSVCKSLTVHKRCHIWAVSGSGDCRLGGT